MKASKNEFWTIAVLKSKKYGRRKAEQYFAVFETYFAPNCYRAL
jgi:hypothetical protein